MKTLIEVLPHYLPCGILMGKGDRTPIRLSVNNFNALIDNEERLPLIYPTSAITELIWYNGKEIFPAFELEKSLGYKAQIINKFNPRIEFISGYHEHVEFKTCLDIMMKLCDMKLNAFNLPEDQFIDPRTLEVNPY